MLGVTDHSLFHFFCFFDPSGHRLEQICNDPNANEEAAYITDETKYEMFEEWIKTKHAPSRTRFLHASELNQ